MSVEDVIAGRKRWAVACGDAATELAKLPDGCVHCCVTSPPYYGLRDYGVAGQIGLETTPGEFIERLVTVFREVKRVLRYDGTCWVNMGDSYAAHEGQRKVSDITNSPKQKSNPGSVSIGSRAPHGFKAKDLMGMPWLLAFALRADGWYLRQDIIWHKPNPMPESVQDRCTKSHEYLFLLSKSARYYFDSEAISEDAVSVPDDRMPHGRMKNRRTLMNDIDGPVAKKHRSPAGWDTAKGSHSSIHREGREQEVIYNEVENDSRNKRSVWTIPTFSYKGAHFATFPPKLVEPCIRAGTSEHGVCNQCGDPFTRTTEKERVATRPGTDTKVTGVAIVDGNRDPQRHVTKTVTTGWEASCQCHDIKPAGAIVLDPFGGSGTTIQVAVDLGRRGIACELNQKYVGLIGKRMRTVTPPLTGCVA